MTIIQKWKKKEIGTQVLCDEKNSKIRLVFRVFLCEWTCGEIGTGDIEEYKIDRLGGIQIPILVDINQLEKLQIVSEAIVSQLINDIKTFGLMLNNVPILINEKNYQKKEAL